MKCHMYDSLLLKEVESLYEAIRGNKDLDLIFSVKHARKVNRRIPSDSVGRFIKLFH
ncbi:MAG: hypothetical protein N2746_04250 [Deltaproteobacteria bacterium]|nr:hypothetical protein [Deltaproteobacteria bacterium]